MNEYRTIARYADGTPAHSSQKDNKYSCYKKDVSKLNVLDIYRFLDLFEVTHPCAQHAIKKITCAGKRGSKDRKQDIQEAIDTLNRMLEMIEEDEPKEVEKFVKRLEELTI